MRVGSRVRCLKAHSGIEVGDLGTFTFGADYVPGWDAGRFTVEVDKFPAESPYGHRAISYWTEAEMAESWAAADEWGYTGPEDYDGPQPPERPDWQVERERRLEGP